MLKRKLYFLLIMFMRLSSIFADDFYAKFHQKDYKVDFQRVELIYYNKSFINVIEIKTFKYNRTLAVVNGTINIKVTMGSELEVAVQFYKFLSNEYRVLRGTNFQVNYCKGINENLLGIQTLFKCGNYTSCHMVKGVTYKVCNFYPDESRFPPLFPSGEYKLEMDCVYRNQIITTIAGYMKVYRPIARLEKKV